MTVKVKDTDQGLKAFLRAISEGPRSVDVGILADAGSKAKLENIANGAQFVSGKTVLEVAIANEFGADAGVGGRWQTPERPFIRGWVDARQKLIERRIVTELRTVVSTTGLKGFSTKLVLERIGLYAQGGIQEFISNRINPPNEPVTIHRKGSDVPLIDTGQLRSSISYKIDPQPKK